MQIFIKTVELKTVNIFLRYAVMPLTAVFNGRPVTANKIRDNKQNNGEVIFYAA